MLEHQLLNALVVFGGALDQDSRGWAARDPLGDQTRRSRRMMSDPEEFDHAAIVPEDADKGRSMAWP